MRLKKLRVRNKMKNFMTNAEQNYEDNIFSYTVMGECGRVGGELRLIHNAVSNIYACITVHKEILPQNNIKSVRLKLKAKPNSTVLGFSIGGNNFFSNDNLEFEADITDCFFSGEETVDIWLSNILYRGSVKDNNIYFDPPTLLIEYGKV